MKEIKKNKKSESLKMIMKQIKKNRKTDSNKVLKSSVVLAVLLIVLDTTTIEAQAMHIMEGFLSPAHSIFWGALCIPFVVAGFYSIKKKIAISPKNLTLLAMCGAFAFVLSSLKIPSVTGSCSHPTGVGLGAILFGPLAMAVIGVIILLFQAVLLAHGGITTLGANTFSMAIVGPIVAFGVYKISKKMGVNSSISVFLAAFSGDIITYIFTSFQLGIAYPDSVGGFMVSFEKFLGIFAVTQLPLAICEGLITVVVFGILEKHSKRELRELGVIS